MRTMLAVTVLAPLLAGCANPFAADPDPVLTIRVGHGTYTVRWPDNATYVTVNGALDDPKGLGGLEIVVSGDNIPVRTYNAAQFALGDVRFKVPDTGSAIIVARIIEDGRTVAEVSERWALRPKIRWDIDVERAPYPHNEGFPQDRDNLTRCQWFWCAFKWRDPIDAAANYEGEALWVVLYRHDPDECLDNCGD